MTRWTNRFYTILIVPEKTAQVKRVVLPAWLVKGSLLAMLLSGILGGVMIYDYWYVMSQIGENKRLKIENRRLRQQVQIFNNKMASIESTMDRVKTFATRLKVITNIEDRSDLIERLNSQKLPDAATNIGTPPTLDPVDSADLSIENRVPGEASPAVDISYQDPEVTELRQDQEHMERRFAELTHEAFLVEQILQDQYELLADQKAFLAALPTRKPVVGYFTSGFGIRKSPYGGREKMHEGVDIANHPGTPIKAPADGVVKFSDTRAGYGQTVIIDHGYGLETWYGHARKLLVRKGQKVKRGDKLALLGNSGRSTGPHLHYEVRVHGTPVDPLSYILEN